MEKKPAALLILSTAALTSMFWLAVLPEAGRLDGLAPRAFRSRSLHASQGALGEVSAASRRVEASAGTLHYVASCTECNFSFCEEAAWDVNEAGVEDRYTIGSPLSDWGCDRFSGSTTSAVVRNSCTGDIYVAEEPAYTTPAPTTTTTPDGRSKVTSEEWGSFQLLQSLRSQGFTCPGGQVFAPNTQPLQFDCALWRASKLHSQDMADQGYFSHTSKDGRSWSDRAREQGATWTKISETLGAGTTMRSGAAVLAAFKDADGQCLNMMDPNFKAMGSGHDSNPSSAYKNYWTQMFTDLVSSDTSCYQ